jgi:hypothetical protein
MAYPDGKLSYATRGDAERAAAALRRGRKSGKGRKREHRIYRCRHPECRGLHLADAKAPLGKQGLPPRSDRRDWMREVEW